MRIVKQTNDSASRLLLPMAYAALVSGMLTLIATPPNLVISNELSTQGYEPLGFFSFSVVGIVALLGLIAYMLIVGKYWLPSRGTVDNSLTPRSINTLWDEYRAERELVFLRIEDTSILQGQTIAQSQLYQDFDIRILDVGRRSRGGYQLRAGGSPDIVFHSGDIIHAAIHPKHYPHVTAYFGLSICEPTQLDVQLRQWEFGAVSALIHPNSKLIGRTLRSSKFRDRYDLDVFSIKRAGKPIKDYANTTMQASDYLLMTGKWEKIKQLQHYNNDFVLLETPSEAEEAVLGYKQMPIALAITAFFIFSSIFNWVPLVAAVLITATLAVVTRCISASEAYRAIHWQSIVLLAGMLPLAEALQQTGATQKIVSRLIVVAPQATGEAMIILLFAITVLLTNILSNTASAVLMAPIAIGIAEHIGVSPYPLALTVLFASSAAFMTPIASPIITLIVEPGKYRFIDFIKLGTPMLLWVFGCCYVLIPWLFPW